MALLQKATREVAFLKAGILGFAGSGKTRTASEIAIGVARMAGDKPVAFFDTETGSDYVIDLFEEAGVELLVAKTRSFADLLTFMREAEESCSVAIIDSISHVWTELMSAYKRKLNRRNGLAFQDWGDIKEEWRGFTDLYLNSALHIVLCGRAGWDYDMEENERGKKELIKTGVKMKAESEMGYEPSLLLEMMRISRAEEEKDAKAKGWIHRAFVMKDRFDVMNGHQIDNPTFESFLPHINRLNIGGAHRGIDTSRNSEGLFETPDGRAHRKRMVEIRLEQIKEVLILADIAGTSAKAKKEQTEALIAAFGTSSWKAITGLWLEDIEEGLRKLRENLGIPEPSAPEVEDDLPDLVFPGEEQAEEAESGAAA